MSDYSSQDKITHQLSQTLAKFNRTFVPKEKDDSHTNLGFDFVGKRLTGRWAQFGDEAVILVLDLHLRQFQLLNRSMEKIARFEFLQKTQVALENEICRFLQSRYSIEPGGFMAPMHYEIPDYDFSGKPIENWEEPGLRRWLHFRKMAQEACHQLLDHTFQDAEVRIWPHHFDTGIYFELDERVGIGFGWAMEDSMVGEPYFYFSGYGLGESSLDYEGLPELHQGSWIVSQNWKGSVLKMEQVTQDTVSVFLAESLRAMRKLA